MKSEIINKIRLAPKDSTLYLVEKFTNIAGIFVSNGNVFYLVKNEEGCISMSTSTDWIGMNTNVYVSSFNTQDSSFPDGEYNILELYMDKGHISEDDILTYLKLCSAHASFLDGKEFTNFFESLISLFQLPKEQSYKNLLGLWGELYFIWDSIVSYNRDLSLHWHTGGSSSRYDFVLPKANFEVKTSSSSDNSCLVKHEQLFEFPNKNYLVYVNVIEENSGKTINELVNKIRQNGYCNNLTFAINLEKELKRISPIDAAEKRFSTRQINIYSALKINPFPKLPENIYDLSYKIDLTNHTPEKLNSII